MRAIATLIATAFLLSGCSSLPGNEEADTGAAALPDFPFTATLGNGTLSAGMPFMVELNSTLASNLTANATWTYQVTAPAMAANETAGNATGNGTENATVEQMLIMEGNGTGIPALANLTLDAGNFTLTVTASLIGYADNSTTFDLAIVAVGTVVEEVEAEPVEDIQYVVPDPEHFEGTMTGAPLIVFNGCVSSDETFSFELAGLVREGTFTLGFNENFANDLDWTITGPGANHATEAPGAEAPKTFTDMQPGTWSVTVACFSAEIDVDYTVDVIFG